jgi:hypothetical protein
MKLNQQYARALRAGGAVLSATAVDPVLLLSYRIEHANSVVGHGRPAIVLCNNRFFAILQS